MSSSTFLEEIIARIERKISTLHKDQTEYTCIITRQSKPASEFSQILADIKNSRDYKLRSIGDKDAERKVDKLLMELERRVSRELWFVYYGPPPNTQNRHVGALRRC